MSQGPFKHPPFRPPASPGQPCSGHMRLAGTAAPGQSCTENAAHCMSVVRVTYLIRSRQAVSSFDDGRVLRAAATDGAPTDLGAGMREAHDQLELSAQTAHIVP